MICSLQNWGLVCSEATSGVKSGFLCRSSSVLLRTRGALESKSRQQLDRCLAATVWAARHHYGQFTFTPGCMKTIPVHQHLETQTETETQEHIYQKPARYVHELKWHLIEIWSSTSRAWIVPDCDTVLDWLAASSTAVDWQQRSTGRRCWTCGAWHKSL